ncbi:MAG: ribokinase [Anaerolineae bacterium]|nr:ribokinase [Anaerolineae bacterium]
MPEKPRITVVGSYNTDLVVRTPRLPNQGETILGGPFFSGPGGKGANQAVAAARLGAQVRMVAKLGNDHFGDMAVENLRREGIGEDYIFRSDASHTGVAFIIVDDTGENVIVVASGTNSHLTPADIDTAHQVITDADVVLFQLESPLETVQYAIDVAHEAGVTVLLNPAPGRVLHPELLRKVDILTPNQTEAEIITGLRISTLRQAENAADALLSLGVQTAVMTLGADGALVATNQGKHIVPSYRVEVVDTTGAGDAFNGALAVAVAEGKSLDRAVAFANAAAALQVTKVGTAPAMPRRDEVEKLLNA